MGIQRGSEELRVLMLASEKLASNNLLAGPKRLFSRWNIRPPESGTNMPGTFPPPNNTMTTTLTTM